MKTKIFNRGLVCVLLTVASLGWVFCGAAFADDAALEAVPAESIFCARLNNFDYSLGQFDTFIAGISPVGVSMMARMQLANMLGDPMLQGIDTAGSFIIFGTAEATQTIEAKPEIFIAALLPVKDYQQFINQSKNVGEPDADGVSKISIPPMMGMPTDPNAPPPPPAKVLLCTKAGQFAMVADENKRPQLIATAKSISSGRSTMSKKVDADQAKLSAEMPLWAYADIELVNKTFAAEIEKAFAKIESEIENKPGAAGQMPMENFSDIMKVYLDTIKSFLEQGKYASIAVKPEPSVLRIKETLAAKPDTEMAKLLTADTTLPKKNKLVTQLEDGATITAAAKVNKAWMKKLTEIGMSFMKAMSTKDANAADEIAKMEQLAKDSVDSMGQLLAFSLKGNTGAKPPFAVEYIVEIKDKEKFDKMIDESVQLMITGDFGQMYKSMGIEMSYELKRGTGEYNGVTIDSARLTMKVTDANSSEAQMIQALYGDGFDYRFAYLDGLNLVTVGVDANTNIKKMIDSIKAGADKQSGAEISAAMTLLGDTTVKDADFFGTLNIIRLMALGMGFVPTPMPMPFDQIPTKSNIAFAGNVGDGKLTADIAVPKEHIMELSTGMQMMMQQQMQQQQQGGETGQVQ